ncbi:MAG: multicopper oxidase domain-containing protein [Candidatus Eremiobacteraeota bacterium]|nr:multicopper oxidase domain-containing protein [Candidatus Eremiobacteraeota bacterium]
MLLSLLALGAGTAALADADAAPPGVDPASLGLQPITGPFTRATPSPGESRLVARPDGTFGAVPETRGKTKIFHLVEREAPWTIRRGLTVMAKTYNGVVPGPVLAVNQGDRVEIEVRNELGIADTLHLHGIHGAPAAMDGVAGMTQPLVAAHGGTFRYRFDAAQNGTFIYHTHGPEALLNAGLYGALLIAPAHPRPEERVQRDYVAIVSSWKIQSASENHFSINGKSYPDIPSLEVARGERIRLRWINISGENMHTMHTHGHDMRVIARDALPLDYNDVQDTILLGPGQRADVVVVANAQPGTWMLHCHIADHIEDSSGHPDGLITAIHYRGTPNTLAAMGRAMDAMDMSAMGPATTQRRALDFRSTVLLGAIAGLTIFFGLPIARMRRLSLRAVGALNAVAIGILVFLVVEITHDAIVPLERAIGGWQSGAQFPLALTFAMIGGLVLGLVGLGSVAQRFAKMGAAGTENPLALSMMIAIGIGAHNFAEGLAIGASAASGATALAIGLIVGFALHNATEGFGVAAPLAGRGVVPSWGLLAVAGLVAGGPTFLGTMIGYTFVSPLLSTLFLAIAAGALVFVIGELWALLKKTGGTTALATAMVSLGFVIAFGTEIVVGLAQRPQAHVTTSASLPAERANATSMAMRSPTEMSRPQR